MAPTGALSSSNDGATALGRTGAVQSLVAQPMGATSVVTLLFDGVPLKNAPVWLRIKDKDGRMKNVLESRTGEKGRALFNNVPQNVAFNLYYIVKVPGFEQRIGYPSLDTTLPPPFPAALTCDSARIPSHCKRL